ncbi:MAG TPA: SET domain-containing protein-lysine N-methyltransferase [Candidatus Woesearchaeota archaeon]|nr:SET domain-containing protein-lysine N-methyltransferase [Candidatus Woesearchaeota archaeon]
MKKFIIRKTKGKGKGLFAARDIKKDELIAKGNYNKLKKWTPKEIKECRIDSDHWDYAGRGKYVLDNSPVSYINHSCEPNCITKYKSMQVYEVRTYKDIKKGEELTHDYSAGAFDIFGKKDLWEIRCLCKSKNCRKILSRNYFELPKSKQKEYYSYLPPSIKKKYRKQFDILFNE